MKILINSLLCMSLLSLTLSTVQAQRFGEGERGQRIEALWVAFITQELELSAEESEKFWPIYREYLTKERELSREKRQLGRKTNSATMSDADADKHLQAMFEAEEKLIALKREYYGKLKTAISSHKVLQLPQVEREFKRKILRFIQEKRQESGKRF